MFLGLEYILSGGNLCSSDVLCSVTEAKFPAEIQISYSNTRSTSSYITYINFTQHSVVIQQYGDLIYLCVYSMNVSVRPLGEIFPVTVS